MGTTGLWFFPQSQPYGILAGNGEHLGAGGDSRSLVYEKNGGIFARGRGFVSLRLLPVVSFDVARGRGFSSRRRGDLGFDAGPKAPFDSLAGIVGGDCDRPTHLLFHRRWGLQVATS